MYARKLIVVSVAQSMIGMGIISTSALAADEPAVLEEIIVTAQKREENIQKIPAAVTALGAEQLAEMGITRTENMSALAPNVDVNRNINVINVFVRGIGSAFLGPGADNSVAVHIDGAYIQPSRALRAGFYDLDRIEVLRGPQGTLYGRNATGGSVNIITKKPGDVTEGFMKLTGGNYQRIEAEAAVGGPIGATTSARISGVYREHGGYGVNSYNGREIDNLKESGARVQFKFKAEDFEALLAGDVFSSRSDGMGWHSLGQGKPGTPLLGVVLGGHTNTSFRDVAQDIHPRDRLDAYGLNLTLSDQLSDSSALKSITAYHDMRSFNRTEIDNTDLYLGGPLVQTENSHWFSEELQYVYTGDRLRSIVGAYYFKERSNADVFIDFTGELRFIESVAPLVFPNKLVDQPGSLDTEATALFANFEYKLTDKLKTTLGLRYSYEKKKTVGSEKLPLPFVANPVFPVVGDKDWSAFTPELTFDYEFTDRILGYAKAGRGFKSGTYLIGTSNAQSVIGKQEVDPEFIDSAEIGLKTRLEDNRLQLNLSAFYYDFTDMQINRIVGNTVFVQNVANASMKGVEAEMLALVTDSLDANLSVGYLDATFGKNKPISDPVNNDAITDISGNPIPAAPKLNAHAILTQHVSLGASGKLDLSVEAKWMDRKYFTVFKREVESQAAYGEWGARVGWSNENDKWSAALWGRNLGDKVAKTFGSITTAGLNYPFIGTVNEPRTFGVDVQYKF